MIDHQGHAYEHPQPHPFEPPTVDQYDSPALSAHELTNRLLYVEGWCADLDERARDNFNRTLDWANGRFDGLWDKVEHLDANQRHFAPTDRVEFLENKIATQGECIVNVQSAIQEKAAKIDRVSTKLQQEVVQVMSRQEEQKSHLEEWHKILGEDIHQQHLRITLLEQAQVEKMAEMATSSPHAEAIVAPSFLLKPPS